MKSDLIKPRRPWLAGLLSLTGVPLGQLYAGHSRRAILLWIFCSAILPLTTALLVMKLPLGRVSLFAYVFLLLFVQLFIPVDAFFLARRDREQKLKRYQRWWVYLLVYIAALLVYSVNSHLFRSYVTEAFVVPGRSMAPAIKYNDRILVDKLFFDASELKRNDLAIHWTSGPNPHLVVKRIMGLPGETVEVREEKLLINGSPATDEFADFSGTDQQIPELKNYGPVTIPAGSFFVLGDNRRNSLDSRMNGPIPADNFEGIARMIYWSNDYKFPENFRRQREPIRGAIRWDRIGKRLD